MPALFKCSVSFLPTPQTLPTDVCAKAFRISFLLERCNTDVGIFLLFISLIAILVKVLFGAIPILTGMPVHCLIKVLM